MIKYIAVAAALKSFSCCPMTKRLYRYLGNTYGMGRRVGNDIPPYYIDRVKRFQNLCRKYSVVKSGDKVLEIGTGWLHWEAMTTRLFYDVESVLYDVWDNRQFRALKHYFSLLDRHLDDKIDLNPEQRIRAHKIIRQIVEADSLDALYGQLGCSYVVDPGGTLDCFPEQSFDLVVSAAVFEHIHRDIAEGLIQNVHRLLKPGGFSIHSINMGDHLQHYDQTVSPKEYLRYSDFIWKLLFQNDVQYFNRIQRPEWLALFRKSGLQLIDEECTYAPVEKIHVHKQYSSLDRPDLECIIMNVVHRKKM